MNSSPSQKRYPPELKQRAVRMALWVPEIRSWPLTSTFAYLQLALKAAPSGPKSVLKVRSDG